MGAGFGGLAGAVIGWLLGAQVTQVPTIGPVVGQWVLPSSIVGLLAGAAIGALVGALAAITTSRPIATEDDSMVSQAVMVLPGDETVSSEYTDDNPVVASTLGDSVAPVDSVVSEEPERVAGVAGEAQAAIVPAAPIRRRRAGRSSSSRSLGNLRIDHGVPAPDEERVMEGMPRRRAPRARRRRERLRLPARTLRLHFRPRRTQWTSREPERKLERKWR